MYQIIKIGGIMDYINCPCGNNFTIGNYQRTCYECGRVFYPYDNVQEKKSNLLPIICVIAVLFMMGTGPIFLNVIIFIVIWMYILNKTGISGPD